MILALLILVPILLLALWAFFRLSPKLDDRRKVIGFNLGVLIFGLTMCGLVTLKVYTDMSAGSDRAWWPVIAGLYSLALFSVVLFLGGLVRNFVLFRAHEPKG
jgi:hypothetical protein